MPETISARVASGHLAYKANRERVAILTAKADAVATDTPDRMVNAEPAERKALPAVVKEIVQPWQKSERDYQRYLKFMEFRLESSHRSEPRKVSKAEIGPRVEDFAQVQVNGKVVARIDNQGVVMTEDDSLGSILLKLFANDKSAKNGPDMAKVRAEHIARIVGGEVVKAKSALSQNQFDALPPFKFPEPTIDYAAMESDPLFNEIQQLKQMRSDYLSGT